MRPNTADSVAARVRVLESIQRRYSSGCGADEFVVELLADLRHFCDAHALSFAKLEQQAAEHHTAERKFTRATGPARCVEPRTALPAADYRDPAPR
jgi:hypothetical protein